MIGLKNYVILLAILALVSSDDIAKSFEKITKDYGYPFEQHYVTTSDGYILKMFRIPYGKNGYNPNVKRPAILIQHGILDSADFVVCHGETDSPAFYLANLGYDIWVSNSRGNKYSRQHTTLNPDKDQEFWDFSFQDMVLDDKANIEYVRQKTGQDKITYIGHSQGTSQMYAALATENQWFEDRLALFASLGSVTRLDHMTTELLKLIIDSDEAIPLMKKLGIYEMFPSDYLTKPSFIVLCGTLPWVCKFGNALIADADPRVDSTLDARVYFGHFPSGTSLKSLEHFAQLYESKKFQEYDDDAERTLLKSGSSALEYNLKSIKGIPIAMFTGNTDHLGDLIDNEWLSGQISDTLVFNKVYDYGHLTFFIGKDMVWLEDLKGILDTYYPADQEVEVSA